MSSEKNNVRIDKYLWAVRLFKTRALATEACRAGRVKMGDQVLKASHEVKVGEHYSVSVDHVRREIEVVAVLENRVGAQKVAEYMTDLTPDEEYSRMSAIRSTGFEQRDRGVGRPTKRDRREIDRLKDC